jgi:DNA-binding GntR family transcriptional regulator
VNLVIDQSSPIQPQVYEAIKMDIVKFHFVPGQVLSEKEISSHLDVSRTPVREAFIRLSQEGLVDIYPQRGTYVSYIKRKDIFESIFIREALEVAVLHALIPNLSGEKIQRLKEIIEFQRQSMEKNDIEPFYHWDEVLHKTMMEFSGYPSAWNVVQLAKSQQDRARYLTLPLDLRIAEVFSEHQQLLNAMIDKNHSLAEKVLRAHLRGVQSLLQKLYEQHQNYFI